MQVASKDQRFQLQGFGRPRAAATIHVCQNKSTQGCTKGRRDRETEQLLLGTYTCVLQNKKTLSCTQGSRVKSTRAWPTTCCCEHTPVCFRKTKSFKAAIKDQRLHGIGRPTAAVSIHMCVWQNNVNSGLAPKGQGLQVLGRQRAVSRHMGVAK